jgi:hypothetical protein
MPTHDRYVVTASADGDDCFGYCDFALGSVPAGGDVRGAACAVIARNWRRKRRVAPQARWQSFMQAGTVSADLAHEMAAKVWGKYRHREDI